MRYQRVRWLQDSSEFPVVLYSEVDAEGWEVRKVDEYADGHRDLAGDGVATGQTALGEAQIPSIEEINVDPEFDAVEIGHAEFEAVWRAAREWFELG
jgi:hypothetical protein